VQEPAHDARNTGATEKDCRCAGVVLTGRRHVSLERSVIVCLAIVVGLVALSLTVVGRETMFSDHAGLLYLVLAGGGLTAVVVAREADERNWFAKRATHLPISRLNPLDDAWVTGDVECDTPLKPPHCDVPCVHYVYERQCRDQLLTWDTLKTETKTVDFRLTDDTGTIEVVTEGAELTGRKIMADGSLFRRHLVNGIRVGDRVSAVGTISEDRERLVAHGNTPLFVSHELPKEQDERAEDIEGQSRTGGYAGLLVGSSMATMWVCVRFLEASAAATAVAAVTVGLCVCGAWALGVLNRLGAYRTRIEAAWHNVESCLRMRADLVPSLVSVVEAATEQEKTVLVAVATARQAADSAEGVWASIDAYSHLDTQLDRALAAVESRAQLGTNETVLKLQDQLKAIEAKIAHSRSFYVDCVIEFNVLIGRFPLSLFARASGFRAFPALPPGGPQRAR